MGPEGRLWRMAARGKPGRLIPSRQASIVRGGAVFALGRNPQATADMRYRVAQIAEDGDEDWTLRTIARAAIGSDPAYAEQAQRFDQEDAVLRASMPPGGGTDEE